MIELACASRASTAAPSLFFDRWVDHSSWSEWSPDTQWVRVEGPVAAGARGVLKPKGGPRTRFLVAEHERDRVYTDVSRVPGATLTFRHAVAPSPAGSELTVRVWLDGPMSWLWARTAFRGFRHSVPSDLDRLIALVES
ncbi:hypothetical protein E1212_15855 [Jiangella ureilytica]|uniref:Polyketide cyclase n=1 Tax=Jiangella ureilytica TaxID=2530374 RepID=A0A4R4RNX9_9ACTN|nr:SRPBCC family protein [Jiangella ureilytica]TDC50193.1 hypothetical protein E1212_15855 [Jiangella ureilytica]